MMFLLNSFSGFRRQSVLWRSLSLLGLLFFAVSAQAQFLGHNYPGDTGLGSGTQPDPGTYASLAYLGYDGDKINDKDGNVISFPGGGGDLEVNGYAFSLWHVTDAKVLGGNYGFTIVPAWTDNRLSIPVLGQSQRVGTGLTDLYVQPINIGWNTARADFMTGFGFYAPVGSYEAGADDNLGLGMWSYELSAGTTIYLDKAKTWSFATSVFYEMHGKKRDTDIRVGDILTLEGGLGKSFMEGAANVGVAYYGQWKVSDDSLGDFEIPSDLNFIGKNRAYGIGPEATLPIASKNKFYGTVNARYLWEGGARSTVQGQIFMLAVSFVIPPVGLN